MRARPPVALNPATSPPNQQPDITTSNTNGNGSKAASNNIGGRFSRLFHRSRDRSAYRGDAASKGASPGSSRTLSAPPPPPASHPGTARSPAQPSPTAGHQTGNSNNCGPASAERSLWDDAYDKLREEDADLVTKYEKLLSRQLAALTGPMGPGKDANIDPDVDDNDDDDDAGADADSNTKTQLQSDLAARRAQLDTLIKSGLERMEAKKLVLQIPRVGEIVVRDQIAKAAALIEWGKDFVGEAIQDCPQAALAWVAVCLVIPLLTRPSKVQEANDQGFKYVSSRIRHYAGLETLAFSSGTLTTDPVRSGGNSSLSQSLLKEQLVELYRLMLDYQIHTVLRFYRRRMGNFVHDVGSLEDWGGKVQNIKAQEDILRQDAQQLHGESIRTFFERLEESSCRTVKTLDDLLSVSQAQLEMARAHRDISSQQLEMQGRQLEAEKEHVELARQAAQQALSAEDNKCRESFHVADYKLYMDRVADRVEGTCQWFLDHENFKKWFNAPSGPLLVSADPGCGKSVLAKFLVRELSKSATVCYFFFKDGAQNTAGQALCSLIHQVLTEKPALIEHARKASAKDLPKMPTALWQVIEDIASDTSAGPIIFVVDALDECLCDEMQTLMRRVWDHFNNDKGKSRLKMLFTSRPYDSVTSRFKSLETLFPTIRIRGEDEGEALKADINKVVKRRLNILEKSKNLQPLVTAHLEKRLMEVPHRTYLWVYLVFDFLESRPFKKTVKGIDESLGTLPATVNDAYESILKQCADTDRSFIRTVFLILLGALEPVSLRSLNAAVNTDVATAKSSQDVDLEDLKDLSMRLRETCRLFISIYDDRVYFFHQTAKEFLLEPDEAVVDELLSQPPPTIWRHSLGMQDAHILLQDLCLKFLSFTDLYAVERIPPYDEIQKDPRAKRPDPAVFAAQIMCWTMFSYAIRNWWEHVRLSNTPVRPELAGIYAKLCDPSTEICRHWVSRSHNDWLKEHCRQLIPFGIHAAIGHHQSMDKAIDQGQDLNEVMSYKDPTPLVAAIASGGIWTAKALLNLGAKLTSDKSDNKRITAVYVALFAQREDLHEALSILLEAGLDPDLADTSGATLLHYVQDPAIVELLIRWKADVSSKTTDGTTPLHRIATKPLECTRLLLEAGADVRAASQSGRTPLHYAVTSEQVELLVSHKADVSATDSDGKTPLHSLVPKETAYYESLVRHGADLEARNSVGDTPLLTDLNIERIEALLRLGADVNAANTSGTGLLHRLQSSIAAVDQLIDLLHSYGADFNICDNKGQTPLHTFVERYLKLDSRNRLLKPRRALYSPFGRQSLITGFGKMRDDAGGNSKVSRMADLSSEDLDLSSFDRDTLAAWSSIRKLCRYGADINARNSVGRTPLHTACESDNQDLAQFLVRLGADRDIRDNEGQVPRRLFDPEDFAGGGDPDPGNIMTQLVRRHRADKREEEETKEGEDEEYIGLRNWEGGGQE